MVEGPARQFLPRLSPDGRFLLYVAEDLGREEVYLTTFPDGAGRWQVSSDGAQTAQWSLDGGKIIYQDKKERLFEVEFDADPAVSLSRPRSLMEGNSKVLGEVDFFLDVGFAADRGAARLLFVEPARMTTEPPSAAVIERWGQRPFEPAAPH